MKTTWASVASAFGTTLAARGSKLSAGAPAIFETSAAVSAALIAQLRRSHAYRHLLCALSAALLMVFPDVCLPQTDLQDNAEIRITEEQVILLKARLGEKKASIVRGRAPRLGQRAGAAGHSDNYHYLNSTCTDCHVMHYSMQHSYTGGVSDSISASGPFEYLLKASTAADMCLICHDGRTGIPDVVGDDVNNPGEVYNGSERAAGRFQPGTSDNFKGHNLPGQGSFDMGDCTWCHDPHGNQNHRNLINWFENPIFYEAFVDPSASGLDKYKRDEVGYAEGISDYLCCVCHGVGTPYNTRSRSLPSHFRRHPSSRIGDIIPINGSERGVGFHTDPGHWVAGTGLGFDQGTGRIPFAVSTATSFAEATAVSEDNEVLCLSCHKAHGSTHSFGLVWNYGAGSSQPEKAAGCQQCHNIE